METLSNRLLDHVKGGICSTHTCTVMASARREKMAAVNGLLDLCRNSGWDSLDPEREAHLRSYLIPMCLDKRTVDLYLSYVRATLNVEKRYGRDKVMGMVQKLKAPTVQPRASTTMAS